MNYIYKGRTYKNCDPSSAQKGAQKFPDWSKATQQLKSRFATLSSNRGLRLGPLSSWGSAQ